MTPCHDGMGVFCSRLAPLTHSYTQPEGRIACTIFNFIIIFAYRRPVERIPTVFSLAAVLIIPTNCVPKRFG